MSRRLKLKSGSEIIISSTAFASGGEGDLYRIDSPSNYKNQVVKIYKQEKQTKEREKKIEYLVANPPKIQIQNGHHSIIWINQIVYESNRFVGFIMYEAKGEKLEYLCHSKLPQNIGQDWSRFDFQNSQSLDFRKKICYNIAAAVFQIHSLGNYVMVDMKPDNIMVQPNGLISIIDVDSIEVIQNNKVLFPAPVATPEYIPPEYYKGLKPEKDLIPDTWDRFSLSIIFYRLLSGIHPFIGTCISPYDKINDASGKIEHGLYPHGKHRDKFRVIPPPHSNIKKLEIKIQELLLTCFDDGHVSPILRPTADDWCRTLSPKPLIKINRLLPSQKSKYENFNSSPPIAFKVRFNSNHNKPILLGIEQPKGFRQFLNRLFGSSAKQVLINQIIESENAWGLLNSRIQFLINEISNLENQFHDSQKFILKKEAKALTIHNTKYQKDIASIDAKSLKLFNEEHDLLQKIEQDMQRSLSAYDLKLKQYYATYIQPIEQQYTSSLDAIQKRNASLLEQEAQEIRSIEIGVQKEISQIRSDIQKIEANFINQNDLLLNNKLQEIQQKRRIVNSLEDKALANALEKFQADFLSSFTSRYKIGDDASSIFHDQHADPLQIVRSLFNYGIVTAADFSAVDSFGQILTSKGKWVKVPHVGVYRADRLESWRKTKLRNTPTSIPQVLPQNEIENVKQQFRIQYDNLEQEERTARNEAIQRKSSIPPLIINQKIEAERKERLLIQDLESKKNQVKVNYTSRRQLLTREYHELQQVYQKELSNKKEPYDCEKAKVSDEQMRIRNKFELDKKHIEETFNPLHLPLYQEAKTLSSITKSQVLDVKNAIQQDLKNNFKTYVTKYDDLKTLWVNLQIEIDIYMDNLSVIQKKYKKEYMHKS